MRFKPDQFWSYFEWLFEQGGLFQGFLLTLVLAVLGFLVGYLVSLARSGPSEGFYAVAKVIREFFRVDLPRTSWRRIVAIGRLAFKEALRRRVLVIVAIFVVIIMFAGWFLDTESSNPARLYISFVVTATNYMVLLLALFLSTLVCLRKSRVVRFIRLLPSLSDRPRFLSAA